MAQEQISLYPLSVKTDRLLLREWNDDQEDWHLMYSLESLPDVVRYQDWEPRSEEEASNVVKTIVTNQLVVPRKHVELCVLIEPEDTHATSQFVARVGCNIKYDVEPVKADLWFAFLPSAQSKGYAQEAMEALIEILQKAGVKRMEIECDPRNQGSKRLAERLGFIKFNEVEKAWESKGEWVGSLEFAKEFD